MIPILSLDHILSLFPVLSLVTATKDYYEIVHKLMELHPNYSATDYAEFGTFITYTVLTIKSFCIEILSFHWLKNIWSLPIVVPDIASAMISEISVLDGYFHNAFTFLETPLSAGKENYTVYGLEKFFIGFINSFFLFLPTSAAHVIFFRRLVFQGIEGGYVAGVGIIAGNILWFTSIIFGWRFFVIPWLSLDILRYLLGFVILIKFMWHASRDKRILTNFSKSKIFFVNFLLAFTEQTNFYPFVSNMSFGAESSILETFPVDNLTQFIFVHAAYIVGLLAGSISLLNLTCWLWENPIAKIYFWLKNNVYMPNLYKNLNYFFLYLTMLCTISSFPYFGLDYTVTNPLGLVSDDRILYQKDIKTNKSEYPEISFLNSQATDKNSRASKGKHVRQERWKKSLKIYKGMDTSLYNQGVYDLLTIEDLNYGFDKFWLRKGRRDKPSTFRMTQFKPQLLGMKQNIQKWKGLSGQGARVEFFQNIVELFPHPNFHEYSSKPNLVSSSLFSPEGLLLAESKKNNKEGVYNKKKAESVVLNSLNNNNLENANAVSALRKFIRKMNTRIKSSEILLDQKNLKSLNNPIYSKRWKQILSQSPDFTQKIQNKIIWEKINPSLLSQSKDLKMPINDLKETWKNTKSLNKDSFNHLSLSVTNNMQKETLSKKERQILRYKTKLALFLPLKILPILGTATLAPLASFPSGKLQNSNDRANKNYLGFPKGEGNLDVNNAKTMLHPIKFYLQKEKAFKRKFKFYGSSVFRKLSIENNAPYFRIMMKRLFYYYKPTLRYKNTIKLAKNREEVRVRKKKSRIATVFKDPSGENRQPSTLISNSSNSSINPLSNSKKEQELDSESAYFGKNQSILLRDPTHHFRVKGKNSSRLRNQIFKQALFNWYYTPFNRYLSKLDIDSFIRRQPNSHFLTKKDEQGLHLKRFLLADHYETLRWYTYMQHYRSMKTKIGGTKSFASKFAYNQQFVGTLKKVRHLFAVTPVLISKIDKEGKQATSSDSSFFGLFNKKSNNTNFEIKDILKFDQPLYNEYANLKTNTLLNQSVTHEELLSPPKIKKKELFDLGNEELKNYENEFATQYKDSQNKGLLDLTRKKQDFIALSTSIVREYLKNAKPIREATIKKLLLKKNYKELTKFVLIGQKTRGIKAITNQKLLLNQERFYLFPNSDSDLNQIQERGVNRKRGKDSNQNRGDNTQLIQFFKKTAKNLNIEQDLWFSLLKTYKKGLYNKKFIKKFVERRRQQRDSRLQNKEKQLKKRLERLKKWLVPNSALTGDLVTDKEGNGFSQRVEKELTYNKSLLTTGLKNAIKDSLGVSLDKNQSYSYEVEQINPKPSPNQYDSSQIHSIFSQLQKEKTESLNKIKTTRSRTLLNSTKNLVNTGFIKTKIVSHTLKIKLQKIMNLIINEPLLFFKLKPLTRKKIKNWHLKHKMLQQRKYTRKGGYPFGNENNKGEPTKSKKPIAIPRNDERYKKISNNEISGTIDLKKGKNNSSSSFLDFSTLFKLGEKYQIKQRFNKNNSYRRRFQQFGRGRRPIQRPSPDPNLIRKAATMVLATRLNILKEALIPFTSNGEKKEFALKKNKLKRNKNPLFLTVKLKKNNKKNINSKKATKAKKSVTISGVALYHSGVLTKKIKRIQLNLKLQQWWWLTFGQPNLQATLESKWQAEKNRHFEQLITNLPELELLERDFINSKSYSSSDYIKKSSLQIGDYDFKPLAIPQALRIRYNLIKQNFLRKNSINPNSLLPISNKENTSQLLNFFVSQTHISELSLLLENKKEFPNLKLNKTSNLINKLYLNIFNISPKSTEGEGNSFSKNKKKDSQLTFVKKIIKIKIDSKKLDLKDSLAFLLKNRTSRTPLSFKSNQPLPKQGFYSGEKGLSNDNNGIQAESKFFVNTNPLPFYAGWDESLRKFVVTNRLLSRRDAGYSAVLPSSANSNFGMQNKRIEFTNAPLQGMNAGTTLYCQVPFTTFAVDQMYAMGMNGYAPIGWRRFEFTHTIFKTKALTRWLGKKTGVQSIKPLLIKNISTKEIQPNNSNLIYKLENRVGKLNGFKSIDLSVKGKELYKKNYDSIKQSTNYSRRIQNRNRQKKRKYHYDQNKAGAFLISGPLIHEVLPVTYLNIFNKQTRLSNTRYIKRRLRREKKDVPKTINEFNTFSEKTKKESLSLINGALTNSNESQGTELFKKQNVNRGEVFDFTFRRRLKTKRKYHRKPSKTKLNLDKGPLAVSPRRHKFLVNLDENQNLNEKKWKKKLMRKRPGKSDSKVKEARTNSKTNSAVASKIRQLKRNISRQVITPFERRQPRTGGFVWPGDYLRLATTNSPRLVLANEKSNLLKSQNVELEDLLENKINSAEKQKITRKIKPKTIPMDLYIQPRKYLLEKHNIKILKKKLEKAQRSNQVKQRVKEFQASQAY